MRRCLPTQYARTRICHRQSLDPNMQAKKGLMAPTIAAFPTVAFESPLQNLWLPVLKIFSRVLAVLDRLHTLLRGVAGCLFSPVPRCLAVVSARCGTQAGGAGIFAPKFVASDQQHGDAFDRASERMQVHPDTPQIFPECTFLYCAAGFIHPTPDFNKLHGTRCIFRRI